MNPQSFANTYIGQQLDNGQGAYKGECVSLAIRAAKDIYGVPYGTLYCSVTGGARDLFEQYDGTIPRYFDRIANDPNDANQLPQAGDLVIWGTSRGKYGHVALVLTGRPFVVYEQLGTPVFTPSTIRTYQSYAGVLGWLRPKATNVPNVQGATEMITNKGLEFVFSYLLHRTPDPSAYSHYVGKYSFDFVIDDVRNSQEYRDVQNNIAAAETARQKQFEDLQAALANEQNKPPREVIKTVTQIVEKPVEVVKEVPVYTHDQATKDNVTLIVKMLKTIQGMIANLFKKK